MIFFTLILMLFISLILISIVNTLIFFALMLVTGERYKEHYLILPSFVSLIIWFMSYTAIVKTISYITGTDIIDSISAIIFNTSTLREYIPKLLLPIIVILIITLFLQSLSLLLTNIDYTTIFNKFRYFVKTKSKSLKDKLVKDDGSDLICKETVTAVGQTVKKYKLSFMNSFVCNLFIFSLLFFLFILFFWIGTLIGNKII